MCTITERFSFYTILISSLVLFPIIALSANLKVTCNDEMVNITAEDVSLSEVVHRISSEMNIRVYLDRSQANNIITADIRGVSFEKGIKTLTYPLNFVIVRDNEGNIQELRIFKTPGLADKSHRIYGSSKAVSRESGAGSRGSGLMRQGLSVNSKELKAGNQEQEVKDMQTARSSAVSSVSPSTPDTGNRKQETGPQDVTGDRALEYGMWVTKRMTAFENIRDQQQVETEQSRAASRELMSLQNTLNTTNIMLQQANRASLVSAPVAAQAYTGDGGANPYGDTTNNPWIVQYTRYLAQQKSFAQFIYYQQKYYSNYSRILNLRGPAAQ